jgi:cytochrome P450
MLTALINAEDSGDVLSPEELVAQVILLYVAGHETTVNLIGNGTLALLRDREQLELWRARPDLDENAVEELLRYDSPVQMTRRVTIDTWDVDGHTIPPATTVIAGLASANRDPDAFGPDADRVRVDRDNARQQVSFGAGVHHCLGAALARLEGRVAVSSLIRRFPDIELEGDPVWNGRINLRGLDVLPVRVR